MHEGGAGAEEVASGWARALACGCRPPAAAAFVTPPTLTSLQPSPLLWCSVNWTTQIVAANAANGEGRE